MEKQHQLSQAAVLQLIQNGNIEGAIYHLKDTIERKLEWQSQFLGLGSEEDQKGFYKCRIIDWLKEQASFRRISPYDYLSICFTITNSGIGAEEWYTTRLHHQFDFEVAYGLANIYSNTGRYVAAIQLYKKVIEATPNFEKAHQQIAFIAYFHQHQFEVAQKYLREGLTHNRNNLYLKFLRILLQQQLPNQNEFLRTLYKQNPMYLRILNNIGKNLMAMQQYDSATECFYQCIKQDPSYPTPYFNLGLFFEKENEIEKSIEYLKKCSELDPSFRYCQVLIGRLHYQHLDLYIEAEEYLREALTHEQSKLTAAFQLGKMNNRRKDFDEAAYWFAECIRINPNQYNFHNSLGIVYQNMLQFEKAINCYNQSIALKPNCRSSLIGLADTYFYSENYDKSAEYYDRLKRQYSSWIMPQKSYLNHSKNLMIGRKLKEAIVLLKQAIRAYPDKLIFYTTLGQLYLRYSISGEAESMFEAAKLKYMQSKQRYDNQQIEEEAIKQIESYCGRCDEWIQRNSFGILNLRNAINLQKLKQQFHDQLRISFGDVEQFDLY